MQVTEAGTTLVFSDLKPEESKRLIAASKQPEGQTPQTLLTRLEVAGILKLHPGSVKRYDKAGILHPLHITSRTVRYSASEVEALLKQREVSR